VAEAIHQQLAAVPLGVLRGVSLLCAGCRNNTFQKASKGLKFSGKISSLAGAVALTGSRVIRYA
jgi:hypothetical protein